MRIKPTEQVPQAPVTMEGAAGCRVRWLVGEADAAPNFAMREFELDPGGHTPRHFHPYEHEIYVLEGEGAIVDGDVERPLRPGDVVYVAPRAAPSMSSVINGEIPAPRMAARRSP
jgi:quercetin dioxygenase-like cupin family protein